MSGNAAIYAAIRERLFPIGTELAQQDRALLTQQDLDLDLLVEAYCCLFHRPRLSRNDQQRTEFQANGPDWELKR